MKIRSITAKTLLTFLAILSVAAIASGISIWSTALFRRVAHMQGGVCTSRNRGVSGTLRGTRALTPTGKQGADGVRLHRSERKSLDA